MTRIKQISKKIFVSFIGSGPLFLGFLGVFVVGSPPSVIQNKENITLGAPQSSAKRFPRALGPDQWPRAYRLPGELEQPQAVHLG